MGQSPSSIRSKSSRRSFKSFARRNKLNKSNLSHTFSLPPTEDYVELMNINTATEEQLMTLPGVNRQLARAIVHHRQLIGRFKRVDDFALVSGVGAEKMELLRPEICVTSRKCLSRTSSCTQSLDSVRTSGESRLCSVNSSSVFQLQCVPGLNQEIAANIVDYRNKKGPFKSLDDLIKVRGMDIVRLGTVKQHLSLDLRKCESDQHLTNGVINGWAEHPLHDPLLNGLSSSVKASAHRKSLSMPTKFALTLPNGFATAPVNDILELLSAYSHRPIIEEDFKYDRNGVKCCRLASWNIHQLSIDKIMNPGVREVICRTILENKLSVIALQDVQEDLALKAICDELNSPVLRRIREWRSNSQRWEYCITGRSGSEKLGFVYDSINKNIRIEDIELNQLSLVVAANEIKRLVDELVALRSEHYTAVAQGFLLCERPLVLVNVHCKAALSREDVSRWTELATLAQDSRVHLAFLGDFRNRDNVSCLEAFEPLLDEEMSTTVDGNAVGHSSILCPGPVEKSNFNGHSGAIKTGLSHLAIPRGWSWGGPASPFCPVWAEINVPD